MAIEYIYVYRKDDEHGPLWYITRMPADKLCDNARTPQEAARIARMAADVHFVRDIKTDGSLPQFR